MLNIKLKRFGCSINEKMYTRYEWFKYDLKSNFIKKTDFFQKEISSTFFNSPSTNSRNLFLPILVSMKLRFLGGRWQRIPHEDSKISLQSAPLMVAGEDSILSTHSAPMMVACEDRNVFQDILGTTSSVMKAHIISSLNLKRDSPFSFFFSLLFYCISPNDHTLLMNIVISKPFDSRLIKN